MELIQVCVEPRPLAVNMTLPLRTFAVESRAGVPLLLSVRAAFAWLQQLSINTSCQEDTQQKTHRMLLLLSISGTEDKRTDTHTHTDTPV